jgi:hypothetical protein
MHRRPRVSPTQPLLFRDWVIPAGVPVGMSAYFQHRDPKVYPRPMEFLPERWLGEVTPAMYRNYIPFSKGSRHCLGMKCVSPSFFLSSFIPPGRGCFVVWFFFLFRPALNRCLYFISVGLT